MEAKNMTWDLEGNPFMTTSARRRDALPLTTEACFLLKNLMPFSFIKGLWTSMTSLRRDFQVKDMFTI